MTSAAAKSLAKIDMLAGLPPATLGKLEQRCAWRHFAAHEQIIDRDSESKEIFFVTDGSVRVVNHSITGREVSYDDVAAGGFFGELGAIDGAPRSASVVAQEATTVAALPAKVFLALLEEHPAISLVILRRLTEIVRRSTDRIMDLSTRGANNRVYAELLRLARQHGGGENRAVIAPVPIHADIASRVSTTRETVARVLSNLAKNELVTREKEGLVIHDVEELEMMVEEFRET